jgi:lipopolysaccharide cholinephosphotransferase
LKAERINREIIITAKERRCIQLIQLEMVIEIDRICTMKHIPYRLAGGSLLGAVRHKGFIPWDPDMDISMDREDYNRFYEVCKTELDKKRFFLQEWRTDKDYRWNYARILRKDTVFVRAGHEMIKSKNGVFVDIICADSVPDNPLLRPIHSFSCFLIRKVLWSVVGKELHPNSFMRALFRALSFIPRNMVFHFRDWVIEWSGKSRTNLCRNMAHKVSSYSESKWGYPRSITKEDYYKVKIGQLNWDHGYIRLLFEGRRFMAVHNYDEALKRTFGDYMKLPPVEQRISHIPCSALKLVKPEIDDYKELLKKVKV